jgi:hypothetical protein
VQNSATVGKLDAGRRRHSKSPENRDNCPVDEHPGIIQFASINLIKK